MKLYHASQASKRLKRSVHISPLNITERSYTTSKLTVRLPSVETDTSFFPTLRPLNTECSVSKLIFYTKPQKCIKISQAQLNLKSNESNVSTRRPKIKKCKTNFIINPKSEESNSQLSTIRMPLPPTYYKEIERMRLQVRKKSLSRHSKNKENFTLP